MDGKAHLMGYENFVEAGSNFQELKLKLYVNVKAHEFAPFLDKFLKDFQTFLDERK